MQEMRRLGLDETKKGRRIRCFGIVAWATFVLLSITLRRGDILGAAGAVGVCFLGVYVYIEQRAIQEKRRSIESLFGDTYKVVRSFTDEDYNKLSAEEKEEFDETSSDIGSHELDCEEGLDRILWIKLTLFVLLTLQWAFGAAIYDLVGFLLRAS